MSDVIDRATVYTKMETREKGNWGQFVASERPNNIMKKRRLRNMVFSTAAVFCLSMGVICLSGNTEQVAETMKHVTAEFEYDETLGRLQFVSSILPESAMVFHEDGDSIESMSLYSPVGDGMVVHAWSQQEPWLEYDHESKVTACSTGEVMAIVQNREGEYTVRLLHEDGCESIYSGLKTVEISQLDCVNEGELLGISGGRTAFEFRKDGLSVMPQFVSKEGLE